MSVAYQALKTVAATLDLDPIARQDLENYDQKTLTAENAPMDFGWIVNNSSTHFLSVDPKSETCSSLETVETFRASFDPRVGVCRTAADRFYFWNGVELQQMNHEDFFKRLERLVVPRSN